MHWTCLNNVVVHMIRMANILKLVVVFSSSFLSTDCLVTTQFFSIHVIFFFKKKSKHSPCTALCPSSAIEWPIETFDNKLYDHRNKIITSIYVAISDSISQSDKCTLQCTHFDILRRFFSINVKNMSTLCFIFNWYLMCDIVTCERCSMYDVRCASSLKCLCALPNADNTKKKHY